MKGEQVKEQLRKALDDLQASAQLKPGQLFVIGCSTSEVTGKRIGTAGTTDIAEDLYEEIARFKEQTGVQLAFQGCEHINRALLIERETAESRGYGLVSVIPAARAGGAMAAYAYSKMTDPVVVEFIKADAGIDIGDTLIGMHLKHVAVPVRSKVKSIGEAHLTMAKTRPKLIGGERAVYKPHQNTCFGK
ncbi:TIGR01440 family protein [Bacillus marinisedimentorum]|uniref:TIGR01440 family protein n=1 Tax=Bacillus marinisedimentorum TaxID=1821260 RepID=UPI0007DF31E7|nr:TIGR01440 family protein [Bacillus marinisedimentorum]